MKGIRLLDSDQRNTSHVVLNNPAKMAAVLKLVRTGNCMGIVVEQEKEILYLDWVQRDCVAIFIYFMYLVLRCRSDTDARIL